jgi:molybdopterin guanine dinucleotide-containing S/N-oxide reductase-like protein
MRHSSTGEQEFINCTVGGPVRVHVRDGKITRVRPLVLDETDARPWTINARGETFSPPHKMTVAPFVLAEKQRVYSKDRVRYPMIREDFNPQGQRNPQNRGKSGYRRISWDEALDIVAGEIARVQSTYGKEALTAITSSHHNWGLVGYKASPFRRFFSMVGYTQIFDNPDSWEGFLFGAPHMYGYYWRLGCPEHYDMLEDCLKHTEMFVHWANDPDTIRGGYCAQESAIWRTWMRKLGIKMVYIDPCCNFTASKDADKWIAPRPGTDSALAEAIAFVWLTEGTYDKDFIRRKGHGFDTWKKHILGESDGQPKTPEWAAELSGVDSATIKALAREWAKKNTILACGARGGFGGAHRTAYGHEWARLMIALASMQGLGKPGNNLWGGVCGAPTNYDFKFPGYADPWANIASGEIADQEIVNPVTQKLYRPWVPKAVMNPPFSWLGEGFCGKSIEQQFIPYTYPAEGCSEVKMFYRYGGSFMGTMIQTNDWIRLYQSDKFECVVNQDVWLAPESKYADVILPACTSFERNDIAEFASTGGYSNHGFNGNNYRAIIYQQKCIEPVGESKSDLEIFSLLAGKLGLGEKYTEGKTEEDWIKRMYAKSDMPKVMSYEEFKQKGYYIVPVPEPYKATPALRWFYEDRPCDTPDHSPIKNDPQKCDKLGTYTGKIEFVSESLKKHTPDDDERGPMPRYQPSWEGHLSELAKKYPLQLISPHPRYSYHTHYDAHCDWLAEIPEHRVIKEDGNAYLPARIHPETAAERGIREGDIIKLFNDRGVVLCVARITERVPRFVVHAACSSGRYVPLHPGSPDSPDKGGCVTILTSSRPMSKKVAGFAPNSCLIDVARWEGQ